MARHVSSLAGYLSQDLSGTLSGGETSTTIPQILAPVGATWNGWWTVYDPTLPADPGLTLVGGEVSAWEDQRNARVISTLAAGNRPPYGADGAHFDGRSVIRFSIAGSKCLAGGADFASNIFAAASYLYLVFVVRSRTAPVGEERVLELSEGGTARGLALRFLNTDQDVVTSVGAVTTTLGPASVDRNACVIEAWNIDPGGGAFLRKNGTTTVNNPAGTGGLAGPVNRFSLGASRSAGGQFGDNSIAELLAFSSYIGDAIALQLVAALINKWSI